MRKFLANSLNLLVALSVISIFLSKKASTIFILLSIILAFSLWMAHYKETKVSKNKNLIYLIVAMILLFLANVYWVDIQPLKYFNSTSPVNQQEIKSDPTTAEIGDTDSMIAILKSMIDSGATNDDVLTYMQNVERIVASRLDNSKGKTYGDMGKVYEAAYILGITKDSNLALGNYIEYTKISPYDSEAYAMVSRYLLLVDKSQSDVALEFADKAYALSKSKESKDSYEFLINHIKSLK